MPEFRKRFWTVVATILLFSFTLVSAQCASAKIPLGSSDYSFSAWSGLPLRVHTYRPENATPDTPIMIVMHGMSRDANRYRDEWVTVADKIGLIIAAPEFDDARFPKSAGYNVGGSGTKLNGSISSFAAIEPLFDDVRERSGSTRQKYYIYGHSAGSQFVHRFVFANPDARIETAFAANAGWYTMLSTGAKFPYGLKGSDLPSSTTRNALQAPLVILLGDADTERASNLRMTEEADAQGYNRLQRGLMFFSHAATLARQKGLPFTWRLAIVPGAGHENGKMAWGVTEFLTGNAHQTDLAN